jgi:hypothetical protein
LNRVSGKKLKQRGVFTIATLGLQAIGKSTLQNALFGCSMPVSQGRTTRGMNVCRIAVDIPGCPIHTIVVQDFEGLMTIDRGDSPFDRAVCLHALAISDLVLLNTMRMLDEQTRKMLGFTFWAFKELRMHAIRVPRLTFVMRDMASADVGELETAQAAMQSTMESAYAEQAHAAGGSAVQAKADISSFMKQPKYVALASALNRSDLFWESSLLGLRHHIFECVLQAAESPRPGKATLDAWVQDSLAAWKCIRANAGLVSWSNLVRMAFQKVTRTHDEALKQRFKAERSRG